MTTQARPTELRVSKDRRTLTVTFADGPHYALPAEMLRVLSPSAEVQAMDPARRLRCPESAMWRS